jgi:ethanolamine-phosphate cytidylyltransferase
LFYGVSPFCGESRVPPEDTILVMDNIEVSKERIWIDGCFDFGHHGMVSFADVSDKIGHAGAILQAKRMGTYLVVGVHSDEEITLNKGPPVMSLDERYQSTW